VSTDLHTVHVRVNDAATGQPTPVRVRFTAPDGTYLAPFGRLAKFAVGRYRDVGGSVLLGDHRYAYIDGTCEVSLPPAPSSSRLLKDRSTGPPGMSSVLAPAKWPYALAPSAGLTCASKDGIRRHECSVAHASRCPFEAAAEDLAVVNLLATPVRIQGARPRRSYAAIPNMLAFSGQQPALEMPGHMIVVNTQNYHRVLGSLGCSIVTAPFSRLFLAGPKRWTIGR